MHITDAVHLHRKLFSRIAEFSRSTSEQLLTLAAMPMSPPLSESTEEAQTIVDALRREPALAAYLDRAASHHIKELEHACAMIRSADTALRVERLIARKKAVQQ